MRFFFLILFYSLFSFGTQLPELNRTVVDASQYLTQSERDQIDLVIRDYFTKTSNQIGVVIVDKLENQSIEQLAIEIFDKWKLGDVKKDNGLLFVFAIKSRKMRIEVGRGLEGDLTDVESRRIQDQTKSYFKNSQYGQGILAQVELAIKTIESNKNKQNSNPVPVKSKTTTYKNEVKNDSSDVIGYIFFIMIFLLVGHSLVQSIVKTSKEYEEEFEQQKTYKKLLPALEHSFNKVKEKHIEAKKEVEPVMEEYKNSYLKSAENILLSLNTKKAELMKESKKLNDIKEMINNKTKKGS